MPTPSELAEWLQLRLSEPQPLKQARQGSSTPIQRLALALDWRDLPAELNADAALLHRERGAEQHWPELTLLGSHDGFDTHLTTGPNYALAHHLGWKDLQEVWDDGLLHGIIATPPQSDFAALQQRLEDEFGPAEFALAPINPCPPVRVAIMSATRPPLVKQVAQHGVSVYITGDMRRSALPALQECGMGILAMGHRQTELWGLRQLARELQAEFADLEVMIYD